MGVFEDILGKAKDVADVAGKKTGEIVELSRLKMQCVSVNNDIKHLYEKLGNAVYSMAKSDYENPELVQSLIDDIDEELEHLNELNDRIADLKNINICSCCGNKNPAEACYCAKCGNRLTREFDEEYEHMAHDVGGKGAAPKSAMDPENVGVSDDEDDEAK